MMLFELQVLTSLEPVDYMFVAFLPGISEVRKSKLLYSFIPLFHWYILVVLQELLFRGALLPIFGINWPSILGVATLFGVLHLGSGRKYSFAVWYYNLFFFALDETFLHLANYDDYSSLFQSKCSFDDLLLFRATFVGVAYGYATMLSSSILVPIASHAMNNLVGGIMWRYMSNSSK